jgi:hypothetical protein
VHLKYLAPVTHLLTASNFDAPARKAFALTVWRDNLSLLRRVLPEAHDILNPIVWARNETGAPAHTWAQALLKMSASAWSVVLEEWVRIRGESKRWAPKEVYDRYLTCNIFI